MPSARTRTIRVIAALLLGVMGALVSAELIYRLVEPDPLQPARILHADGSAVPLSSIAAYAGRDEDARSRVGARSKIVPGLDVRFCYDGSPLPWFDADGCVAVRTNSLGFRDEEFAAEKPSGETRVLCVGDSFTFGNGVRMEDTWVEQLEDLLVDRVGPVQVINGGFAAGSYNLPGYVEWIREQGLLLDPDLVVIGVCLNDIAAAPMALAPPPVDDPWLGGWSRLLLHFQSERAAAHFETLPLPDAGILLELDPEPWNLAQEALLAIHADSAAHDVPVLVVVFAMLFRLDERYPYRGLHVALEGFCREHGIPFVDTLPGFLGHRDQSLWAHPTDQHPGPAGHRIIARQMLQPVCALLGR